MSISIHEDFAETATEFWRTKMHIIIIQGLNGITINNSLNIIKLFGRNKFRAKILKATIPIVD